MHVISREPFREAAAEFPNDATALDAIYLVLKGENFRSPDALKSDFSAWTG